MVGQTRNRVGFLHEPFPASPCQGSVLMHLERLPCKVFTRSLPWTHFTERHVTTSEGASGTTTASSYSLGPTSLEWQCSQAEGSEEFEDGQVHFPDLLKIDPRMLAQWARDVETSIFTRCFWSLWAMFGDVLFWRCEGKIAEWLGAQTLRTAALL